MNSTCLNIFILALAIACGPAFAQTLPDQFTIEGRLSESGTPLSGPVEIKFEIVDSAVANASCVLFRETHSVTLGAQGIFALKLGTGTSQYHPAAFSTVFANGVSQTGIDIANSSPCSFTPSGGSQRQVKMYVSQGGGPWTYLGPDTLITTAPTAMVAETLQGKDPSNFVQIQNNVTQAHVEDIFSTLNYPKLVDLLNGTSSTAVSFNNKTITDVGNPSAGTDATNKNYVDANIGGKTADLSGVGPATGDGYTLIWDKGAQTWTTGVPSTTDNTKLPLDGSVAMTGTLDFAALIGTGINLNGNDLLATGHITMSPQRVFNLGTFTDVQELTLSLTLAQAGASWYNTTSKTFKIWDGTTAVSQTFNGATAGGDLTGNYPNPTIANDKILSDMIDSGGVNRNLLVISDQTTGDTLKFATCNTNDVLRYEDVNGWVCRDPSTIVTFPVTSVNGKDGGAVVLDADDLGLGTASLKNFGTDPGNVPLLDGTGKIPAALLPTGTGTITEVAAGIGLSGGGTSGTVTLDLADTVVTPGTYGAANKVATFTVDQQGRLTTAGQTNISVGDANITDVNGSKVNGDIAGDAAGFTGNLGGDVTGLQGAAVVKKIQGRAVANITPTSDQVLMWNDSGSQWEPKAIPSAPVSSIAGRTGAVTLDWADITSASSKYMTYKPGGTACGSSELLKFDGINWVCVTASNLGLGNFMKDGSVAMTGDFNGGAKSLINIGTNIDAAGALTITTASNSNLNLSPNGAGLVTTSTALRVTPTSLPVGPPSGTIVFDSNASNALKYYNGADWQTVNTSNATGDFMKDGSVAMTGNLKLGVNYINNDGGANEGLAFDTSGNANFTGKIGIGTTTPQAALDVRVTSVPTTYTTGSIGNSASTPIPLLVDSNAGWPQNGLLSIDNEIMAFEISGGIQITGRGQLGTAVANHDQYAPVSLINFVAPGANAGAALWTKNDGATSTARLTANTGEFQSNQPANPDVNLGLGATPTPPTSPVSIGSTDGWPSSGIMTVDGEMMSFYVVNANSIRITGRGLYGTVPTGHFSSSSVTFANLIASSKSPAPYQPPTPSFINNSDGRTTIKGTMEAIGGPTSVTLPSVSASNNISLSVGSTINWPPGGIMIIDEEILSYYVTSMNSIRITGRGLYGTSATSHSSGTQIAFINTLSSSAAATDISYTRNDGGAFFSGKVGIGTTGPLSGITNVGDINPVRGLDVQGADNDATLRIMNTKSSSTARFPNLNITNYAGSVGGQPNINLVSSRGFYGAASSTLVSDPLGGINAFGYAGSSFQMGASILFAADANFSLSSYPTNIIFKTANSSLQERMRITPNGNVGIGTISPFYKLDVVGDINGTCIRAGGSTVGGTCSSDQRLKTDIQAFNLGLDALQGIVPHYFKYNGLGEHPESPAPELGVIAQEVERTAPQLIITKDVKLHPDDTQTTQIKQVNYTAFIYVLINSVKELYQQMLGHDREIASIKADNQKLKEENAALKAWACSKDPSASFCN